MLGLHPPPPCIQQYYTCTAIHTTTVPVEVPSNKPGGSIGGVVVCIEQAVCAAKTTLQSIVVGLEEVEALPPQRIMSGASLAS